MKSKLFVCLTALALGFGVSTATACPGCPEKTAKKDDKAKLVKQQANTPCHGAKTVAAKVEDGRSELVKNVRKGGCNKPCGKSEAKTVSAGTSPCGKKCDGNCTKDCCKKGAKTVADKGYDCPISKRVKTVLASMPAMEYRVGDEVIGCSKSAEGMAKKSGKSLEFVIGKESFKDKGNAIVHLTKLLESEASNMQAIQFSAGGKCGRCPMTAKSVAKSTGTKVQYRVGGVDFDSKADAEKVVKLVSDAVREVAISYKVDGKTYHCNKTAGSKCKKTGKAMTYVIGDQETGCETSAKLMQTEMKVRKIVETAVAASFSL